MKLLPKFAIVMVLFSLVTMATTGVVTYFHLSNVHKTEMKDKTQQIAEYLSVCIGIDGENFPTYQQYFLSHYKDMNIPRDFDLEEMLQAEERFETQFAREYPGKVLGKDVTLEELSEELQKAYAIYNHEYYLYLFEKASESFGLSYCYYLVPVGDDRDMCYVLDAVREEKKEGDASYIDLGIVVSEPWEKHKNMWRAWEWGKPSDDYDVYDESYQYGMTYAWYSPLFINGKKCGVIGTEVSIPQIRQAVFAGVLDQIKSIGLILLVFSVLALYLINRLHISKIRTLSAAVGKYTYTKDAAIAEEIKTDGKDELQFLANETAAMIVELDKYTKDMLKTTKELTHAKALVGIESEKARKDELTGVRNRTSYEEEVRILNWRIRNKETDNFGFAVMDVNFLKKINDTYGHEAGNKAIQDCCKLLCDVFAHSPVFRIGGDEFVVILEGCDCDHAAELTERFLKLADGRAAIGYSFYDSGKEEFAEDVFKRADEAMYEKKKEMKAVRK